jgi:hypothetical protein
MNIIDKQCSSNDSAGSEVSSDRDLGNLVESSLEMNNLAKHIVLEIAKKKNSGVDIGYFTLSTALFGLPKVTFLDLQIYLLLHGIRLTLKNNFIYFCLFAKLFKNQEKKDENSREKKDENSKEKKDENSRDDIYRFINFDGK